MAKDGYYVITEHRSGMIGEKTKCWVSDERSPKRDKCSLAKQEANDRGVVRKVARMVNANFRAGDGWLTLTYDPKRYERVVARAKKLQVKNPTLDKRDAVWLSAQHEAELLMDRVRYECRKQGIALRYILITSDMDGDTKEAVRVHHHLIVNEECIAIVKAKWGGRDFSDTACPAHDDRLWAQKNYQPLVEYMLRQVRHVSGGKRYSPSRNLIKREPKKRKARSCAQLRPPKGCELVYADPYTGQFDGQYICYILPPEKWTGVWAGKTWADVEALELLYPVPMALRGRTI